MKTIPEMIAQLQKIAELEEKLKGNERLWDIFAALALNSKDATIQLRITHDWDDKVQVEYVIDAEKIRVRAPTLQEAWTEYCKKKSPPPPAETQLKEVESVLGMPADTPPLPEKVLTGKESDEV